MFTLKQLLLDITDIIDNDIIDAYQQMSNSNIKQIIEQSDKNQYEYILQIVAYLNRIKTLFEEQLEEHINNDYETMIQQLEASIRNHIRVEQQQKLQIEQLIQKLDEIIQDKDYQIKILQDKIKSQESIIKEQNKKLSENSPIEIIHRKTPSAFDRLSKLVSNKSQKSLQTNDSNFKALFKICNTEKDRSLSKGRKQQYSAKRDFHKSSEETQNLEPKLTERELTMDRKHKLQKSEKILEQQQQQQQSLSVEKFNNKYKTATKQSPQKQPENIQQSQSFEQTGKNLLALQRQISNSRMLNNQTTQLLKFLTKK